MTRLWGARQPGQDAGSTFPSAGPQLTDRKRNRSRQHGGHTGRIRSNRLGRKGKIVEQDEYIYLYFFLPLPRLRPNRAIINRHTDGVKEVPLLFKTWHNSWLAQQHRDQCIICTEIASYGLCFSGILNLKGRDLNFWVKELFASGQRCNRNLCREEFP